MSIPILQVPDYDLVTQWLIDLVSSKLPTGEKCGDHRAEFPSDTPIYPYNVLYGVPGGTTGGPPLGAAQADATFIFQIDSVGLDPKQARKQASRVRHWVAGRTETGAYAVVSAGPDGISISDRIGEGSPGAPLLEGTPPTEVYTVSDLFAISVSVRPEGA